MEHIIAVDYQASVTASASYHTLAFNLLPHNPMFAVNASAQERC